MLHDRQAGARSLSLASAAREAVSANLDLAAFDQVVAAGRQTVRAARAAWRPQLTASIFTETPGPDPVARALGDEPPWLAAGSMAVSQLLYSEPARAEAQIQDHLQRWREQSREELRLQVAHSAAIGYLDILRAKAFEHLQRENLRITRSHLDLAESRRGIGVARPSEVVRWESQIAVNRRDLVAAGAQRRSAEIELNRQLDPADRGAFETAGIAPHDPALLTPPSTLDTYAGNPAAFERFLEFMAAEGAGARAGAPADRRRHRCAGAGSPRRPARVDAYSGSAGGTSRPSFYGTTPRRCSPPEPGFDWECEDRSGRKAEGTA